MVGVKIQHEFTAPGNWALGAALAGIMLAAYAICFAVRGDRAAARRPQPDQVDDVSARRRPRLAGGVFTALVLVFLLVPLAIVVLFSLHSSPSLTFPFEGFSTRWYDEVFGDEQFREALFNSLELALATAAFTFVLGTAAAYGVTRAGSRLAGAGVAIFLLPITLPLLFIGIALLIALRRVGIELSLLTILIGHTISPSPSSS